MKIKDQKFFCSLIMDEMCLKKNVSFNGKRLQSYIDYSTGKKVVTDFQKLK